MVRTKDQSVQLCVDYRDLNECTLKNTFPLPHIQDILDNISSNIRILASGNDPYGSQSSSILHPKGSLWVERDALWSLKCTRHIPEADGPCARGVAVGDMPNIAWWDGNCIKCWRAWGRCLLDCARLTLNWRHLNVACLWSIFGEHCFSSGCGHWPPEGPGDKGVAHTMEH